MSEFGQNLKNIVIKGIEAIGNSAETLATNTKQKVEEFNLTSQLKDIYTEIGARVFELSKKGVGFPEELSVSLQYAEETEMKLKQIKDQKAAFSEDEIAEQPASPVLKTEAPLPDARKHPAASEYVADDEYDVPVIHLEEDDEADQMGELSGNNPLSSAINDLFENMPPVDKMMDKVNSSLDDLGDSLRKFSGDFDKQLNDFADQMMGKNDEKQ